MSSLWPLVRITAKRKVQLLDGAVLLFQHVVLLGFRDDSFLRVPGFDLLALSPPGTLGAAAVILNTAALTICFPVPLMVANANASGRLPTAPGGNVYKINVPQPGCVNSSSAPLMDRCWPIRNEAVDCQSFGADADLTGRPTPNNYNVYSFNLTSLCMDVLKMDCIQALGPIGCLITVTRNQSASLPPLEQLLGTGAGAGGGGGAAGDSGGGGVSLVAVLVGAIVGGAVLVAAVFIARAIVVRRRPALSKAPPATSQSGLASGAFSLDSDSSKLHALGSSKKVSVSILLAEMGIATDSKGPSPQPAAPASCSRRTACGEDAEVVTSRTPLRLPLQVELLQAPDEPAVSGVSTLRCTDSGSSVCASTASAARAADVVQLLPEVLGSGGSGKVHAGLYGGQRVAVKQFCGGFGRDHSLQLRRELDVLGRCSHPNLVRVLAACVLPPSPCLVLELCDTSLDKLLYGSPGQLLPVPLVLHIATEVARGLAYLHPTIVHRDLKPGNVLINDPWGERPAVKITDFGLSRLHDGAVMTQHPEAGTPAYIAPECYDLANWSMSCQADIYSIGVLLWEMLAGARPWEGLGPVPIACVITLQGRRLPMPPADLPGSCPSRWPYQLVQLISECWDRDPSRRPAAAELAKRLVLLAQKLQLG